MLIGRPKRDRAAVQQIKDWASEHLPITEDAIVRVMELQCHETGCPPLETVIAAMEQGKDTRQWKLHKAIPEVTLADITELAASTTSQDS